MRLAGRRQLVESRDHLRVLEKHGRDEHRRRALGRLGRQPLRKCLGRARHDHDVQQLLLGEAGHQPPERVELAARRHQPGAALQVEGREEPEHEPERVLVECEPQRRAPRARPGNRRAPGPPSRRRGPTSRQRGAASSQALTTPSRPTSGHAWCECPSGAGARRRGTPSSAARGLPRDQSSERTAPEIREERLVERRPEVGGAAEPPVPGLEPIVRSTIFTWW